jgi:LPS-assembly protein
MLMATCAVPALGQTSAPDAQPVAGATERVELTADTAYVLENENTVVAEGNVTARYQERVLTADRLTYNRDTGRVRARGNVTILEPDGTQRFADEIETESDLSDGYATGFSMRTPAGDTASANSVIRRSETLTRLDRAIFTSCEICEDETTPTWAIRARTAVFDEEEGMYSYRDAVFEIAGVPIIYLPYFAHPDPNAERRSGFLIPTVGSSSKYGVVYQQPYYWAISPHQDLVISPRIFSQINPLLELDYRKRFYSGDIGINTSMTYEQFFDGAGEKFGNEQFQGHIFADGKFRIDNNWRWGFGIEEATDDLYTERYDIEGENELRGLYANQPRTFLSQLYTQGQSRNWYADVSLLTFDSLSADGTREDAIADILPFANSQYDFDLGQLGYATLGASAAVLKRVEGIDSGRFTASANWTAQRVLPGGLLVEPFANARVDYYDLNDFPVTGDSDNVQRTLGSAGAKLSMPFYRSGETVDLLVEPLVMAAWSTSSPNDDPVPIEDSSYYELDIPGLFQPNAQAGYDLYEGGNKLAAGLSASALWKSGFKIDGIIGRRWRDEADPAFDVPSNLDGTSSDWLAGLSVDLNNPFSLDAQVRLDSETFEMHRLDTTARVDLDRLRASVVYYQIDEAVARNGIAQEGIILTGEVNITDNYLFLYSLNREIEQKVDIEHAIGVAYQDDCSRFELVYERTERLGDELGPSDSILFRFSLKTIGQLGSSAFN